MDMVTQAHLARHVMFHIYHRPAIPRHAQEIFGIAPKAYRALRDSGWSPERIAALRTDAGADRFRANSTPVWFGSMRARVALLGAVAAGALTPVAAAQAPAPTGNFGGGGLVAPPRDHFGAGNAVIAVRALPANKLEIEGTVRGSCGGGEFITGAKIAEDGSFDAAGSQRTTPAPKERVTTTYKLAGTFTSADAASGILSATIKRRAGGKTKTCRSGEVRFGIRRPDGVIGKPGAPGDAIYYGTTSQRGVGPRRPIVLRISSDGRVISRALFGEFVRCSDDTRSAGLEAPRTNVPIESKGRVDDHERFTIRSANAIVKVNDSFTATFGETGATGTFSLSDRTTDKTTGTVLRTCKSGVVKWSAAP